MCTICLERALATLFLENLATWKTEDMPLTLVSTSAIVDVNLQSATEGETNNCEALVNTNNTILAYACMFRYNEVVLLCKDTINIYVKQLSNLSFSVSGTLATHKGAVLPSLNDSHVIFSLGL